VIEAMAFLGKESRCSVFAEARARLG